MNRGESEYWSEYTRYLANRLELRDWSVRVSMMQTGEGVAGQANITYGTKDIWIQVGWNFGEETPKHQRHVLIHELLHCHFESQWQRIQTVRNNCEQQWVSLLDYEMRRDMEVCMEAWSHSVEQYLDFPPARAAEEEVTGVFSDVVAFRSESV